jgi:hypothetical protein
MVNVNPHVEDIGSTPILTKSFEMRWEHGLNAVGKSEREGVSPSPDQI